MVITDFCIRRPVFTTVMTLIIVILGIVTGFRLPLRQLPKVDKPVITVLTDYPGASPQIIESQVTKPLEDVLVRIEGLDFVTSSSTTGNSRITLKFRPDRDLEVAANDVRDALSRIRNVMPEEATDPIIKKADLDARPMIILALSSNRLAPRQIADYADRYIVTQLEVLPGVASVDVVGGGVYTMKIVLDPLKLAAYRLSADEVRTMVNHQNIEKPAGTVMAKDREYTVTTTATLDKVAEFEQMVVYQKEGQIIRIKDIGHVEIDAPEHRNEMYLDGRPAVGLSILKQSVANPLDIAKAVRDILPRIQHTLPRDMNIEIAHDRTLFIEESIHQVYKTLYESIVLVVLVVFLFLWSLRASMIPLVAIPVSLIGVFVLLYVMGFSINNLTLLAMVLAIGLVVDDAIVILENIYAKIEKGIKPLKAASEGSREIAFAVIAMTLTLVAVYAPIALATGTTGRMFREFAMTLAGAVLISGFVALTASPMMCALWLRGHASAEGYRSWNILWLEVLEKRYSFLLGWVADQKKKVLAGGAAFALGGYVLMRFFMSMESAPPEDQGLLKVLSYPPQGITLEYARKYAFQLNDLLKNVPEAEKRLVQINTPELTAMCQLKPWKDRSRTGKQIADSLRDSLENIPGMPMMPSGRQASFSGGDGHALEFVVQTTKSLDYLERMASITNAALQRYEGLENVTATIQSDVQDFVIKIDRERAANLGVDLSSIANTINALVAGKRVTQYTQGGKRYDVRIEIAEHLKDSTDVFRDIYMKGDREQMIPLSELIHVEARSTPPEIQHFNQFRSIQVSGEVRDGYSLQEVITYLEEFVHHTFPDDVRIDYAGDTRSFVEETHSMYLIFGLALLFIFLVLAAQFESFRDPIMIMLTVPLSLSGAVITLACVGQGSLNVYSQIGCVTLIGLITKHGILMVDFANKLQESEGLSRREAIIRASQMRLRPILMTTCAMVLGAIPLALATGAGAEARRQIGWVVVGGMTLGTLLTLIIVPAVYMVMGRQYQKKGKLQKA